LSHFGLPGFLFVVGTGLGWDTLDWRADEFILESSGSLAGFNRSDNPSKLWISSRRKGPAFRLSVYEPACLNFKAFDTTYSLKKLMNIWMSNKVTTMTIFG